MNGSVNATHGTNMGQNIVLVLTILLVTDEFDVISFLLKFDKPIYFAALTIHG